MASNQEPVVTRQVAQPTTGSARIKAPKIKAPKVKAPKASGNKLSHAAAVALVAKHNAAAKASQEVAPGLTLGQLTADTNAATGIKYGPAEQALGRQVAQNQAQGARTSDWYGQYQQAIAQAAQQQQSQNQAAVAGVGQLQQGLDKASMQAWAGQQAATSADAASRGATADPKLADVAHNASNVRNALTGSYGAMLLSQGAAGQTGLANRGLTANQQGLEALKANAAAGADLGSQRTALEKEKGQFKVQFQQQEKAGAADTALKNVLTQAQAQQYGANAVQSLASANNSNANAAKTNTITAYVQKYGRMPPTGSGQNSSPAAKLANARLKYFNQHGYFPPTGPPKTPKGAGGYTRTQIESARNNFGRARSIAATLAKHGNKDVGKLTQLMIAGYPAIPPWMAKAAAEQYVNGTVDPHLVKRLRQHGVKGGYNSKPKFPGISGAF